ncbi:MAG: nitrile hydratase accessory protein [Alphaproteobacteria bacterium]
MSANNTTETRKADDPGSDVLPGLPRDEDGPIFAEPWQAQAFAMVVSLHARGLFTWPEWADRLGAQIKHAQHLGDADLGDTYYSHWLRALELIVAEKGVIGSDELACRRDAWDLAARATAHGEPIVLGHDRSTAEHAKHDHGSGDQIR